MGQHDGDVVDRLEALAFQIVGEVFEDRDGGHAESGFADFVAGNARPAAGAGDDEDFADAQQVGGDGRAVDADLVGLLGDGDIVGHLDLGHDETVLRGELLAHLADTEGELLVGAEQARRDHLAECELDLGGAQHCLDRILFQFLALDDLLFFLLAAKHVFGFDLTRMNQAPKARRPPRTTKGTNGRPGIRASTNINTAETESARG